MPSPFRFTILLSFLFSTMFLMPFNLKAVAAGVLTIETQTTLRTTDERMEVEVTFTNKGTAEARDLQIHLLSLGQEQHSAIHARLAPGQSEKASFQTSLQGLKRGRYPMTVRVIFHDENQYPFTALSGLTFFVQEDVNPQLVVQTKDVILQRKASLSFDIKNLEERPLKVQASLQLPREISCPQQEVTLDLASRSETSLTFEIVNFAALPGASYPIFCFFEYDSEEAHHTAVSRVMVQVAKDENLFRRLRWLWISLCVALAGVAVFLACKSRRQRSRLQGAP